MLMFKLNNVLQVKFMLKVKLKSYVKSKKRIKSKRRINCYTIIVWEKEWKEGRSWDCQCGRSTPVL